MKAKEYLKKKRENLFCGCITYLSEITYLKPGWKTCQPPNFDGVRGLFRSSMDWIDEDSSLEF